MRNTYKFPKGSGVDVIDLAVVAFVDKSECTTWTRPKSGEYFGVLAFRLVNGEEFKVGLSIFDSCELAEAQLVLVVKEINDALSNDG